MRETKASSLGARFFFASLGKAVIPPQGRVGPNPQNDAPPRAVMSDTPGSTRFPRRQ